MTKISLKLEYLSVLLLLQKLKKPIEGKFLAEKLNLPYEKLMSNAVFTLQELGLALFTEEQIITYQLTKESKEYIKDGLPERQIFNSFTTNDRKDMPSSDLQKEVEEKLGFNKKFFFIGLMNMKKNRWILASKAGSEETIYLNQGYENPELTKAEEFIVLFKDSQMVQDSALPKDLKKELKNLQRRKLFTKDQHTDRTVKLTEKGASIKKSDLNLVENEIQLITSEMIKSGAWKDGLSNLKNYEVNALAPVVHAGKYHPLTIIINEIREIFHSMGFEEIKGPIIETAFYNFDSLYQPQDHPAREMHDTFYLKNPAKGKLPSKKQIKEVKATHENGGKSGSTGWGYDWSENIAEQSLLRTHTTATTIRKLGELAKDTSKLPKKVFCIDRVFRNEKVDRTHLAEFQQIEGIIIGEEVSLSNLIGQIVEFYKKMGFEKIVTRPGFFPYTEPSMEIAVYSEELGQWLEMGGSGIFRPEVTNPWGIKEPVRVLAWGMGLERLAMLKLKRKDIRDLYESPISWLREVSY